MLSGTCLNATTYQQVSDSLQHVLAYTADPGKRVELLLDLKDLNEDSNLNLAYSIQLFREAATIRDTYAMTAATVPILVQYAPYPEKTDSLNYYVRELRELTPGTPEEGMDAYAEMSISYYRLNSEYDEEKALRLAHEIDAWCNDDSAHRDNIYHRVKRLLLKGHAGITIGYYEKGIKSAYIPQTKIWEEAYELTRQMPELLVRKNFANLVYFLLSGAYNQARDYDNQVRLTTDYIALIDSYYAMEDQLQRRPYLYRDNSYVNPYRQLIRCSINIERDDLLEKNFAEFRDRMLNAEGENLVRNKTYVYELGYLWNGIRGHYDQSILYCDSLLTMIDQGKGYFRMNPSKIYQVNRDRSVMLYRAGRYDESYDSYERTAAVQDSIFSAERRERSETIRRRHDMDRLKLAETHGLIRNRAAVIFSFVAIGILLIGTGVYFTVALRRNRRLQADIARHNRKAKESEHMKSIFISTICRGIGQPLDTLDQTAQKLMLADTGIETRLEMLGSIRENTDLLLSTLDNMLEAANLDSLTDQLQLEETDIDELCRAELLTASRLQHGSEVEYRIETPGTRCIVRTHAQYFSFVVRALLDNAAKFTSSGNITLRYETDPAANMLQVSVTDTGCGIAPERQVEIFRPLADGPVASRGLSLSLCRIIAEHLRGSIRLDSAYTAGARFIFTIPLKP
ncbi:HAMP domain-containing histidine kinase [Alistipes sp. kh20]|uniref:sensor histidine kinase n=1 Tax=Alistipes montrealensis TaxID=2834113 RepID=UPI001BCB5007|nr:HAMP domain-containing sensor histidine kinase [Alistipes montrealensis]MBS4766960.1 HAMP domain-containing histidine kinase [Alistipes montrealensis]